MRIHRTSTKQLKIQRNSNEHRTSNDNPKTIQRKSDPNSTHLNSTHVKPASMRSDGGKKKLWGAPNPVHYSGGRLRFYGKNLGHIIDKCFQIVTRNGLCFLDETFSKASSFNLMRNWCICVVVVIISCLSQPFFGNIIFSKKLLKYKKFWKIQRILLHF